VNTGLLLRAMVFKEMRMMMRERGQMLGMVIAIVAVFLPASMGTLHWGSIPGDARPWPAEQVLIARWVGVLVGAGIGAFLGLGYLTAAVMASFAGEKEAKTLEILLAAPIGNTKLFLLKCASVLLPAIVAGYLFQAVAIVAGELAFRQALASVPINIPVYVLLGMPPVVLLDVVLVGFGAAVSAKSETVKGASQVFAAVAILPIFAIPLVVRALPRHLAALSGVMPLAKMWLAMPFAVQYISLLGALSIPALLSLAVGRALFQRDRILS
jgi:ABC-type Na+ efflux pump permease subunit